MAFLKSGCLVVTVSVGLLLSANPATADIYAFVDSKGVRHISNEPDDPRYKLVMRTPKYKKPKAKIKPPPETTVLNPNGDKTWNLLKPNSTTISAFGGRYLGGKAGKPFRINETTRRQLSRSIAQIAARYRLDPHLIHAVISAESAFNPRAISHAGAMGLMQLMPDTAKRFGVQNPFDPVANMRGGAQYLRWLLDHFSGNLNLALAGYNAGEGAVKRYGNTIPPYKETQTYVMRVLQFYNHYKRVN